MKEIKYKFWLNQTKKMTYEHTLRRVFEMGWVLTDDMVALEFTGFKDCKQKEIYDGDILSDCIEVDGRMIQSKQQVFFCEKQGCWMIDESFKQDKSASCPLWIALRDYEYEVTGNVFEVNYPPTPKAMGFKLRFISSTNVAEKQS